MHATGLQETTYFVMISHDHMLSEPQQVKDHKHVAFLATSKMTLSKNIACIFIHCCYGSSHFNHAMTITVKVINANIVLFINFIVICHFEVQMKMGAEPVYNGIVGPIWDVAFCFVPKFCPTMSLAPVFP